MLLFELPWNTIAIGLNADESKPSMPLSKGEELVPLHLPHRATARVAKHVKPVVRPGSRLRAAGYVIATLRGAR